MSEDEVALYSELQKEFTSIRDLKKAANITAKINVQGGITKGQARSLNSVLRKTLKGKVVDDKTFRKAYKKPIGESIKAIVGNDRSKEAINKATENVLNSGRDAAKTMKDYYTSRGGKLDKWMNNIPRI